MVPDDDDLPSCFSATPVSSSLSSSLDLNISSEEDESSTYLSPKDALLPSSSSTFYGRVCSSSSLSPAPSYAEVGEGSGFIDELEEEEEEEEHIYESLSDWQGSLLSSAASSEWTDPRKLMAMRSAAVWSDCGARLSVSREFFPSEDEVGSMDSRRMDKALGRTTKFASESNIEDALVMMEPGLRRIPKDTDYTTEEEEEEEAEMEDILPQQPPVDFCYHSPYPGNFLQNQHQAQNQDSGFSSSRCHYYYPHLQDEDDSLASYITVISVNQPEEDENLSAGSSMSPTTVPAAAAAPETKVTVNGLSFSRQ